MRHHVLLTVALSLITSPALRAQQGTFELPTYADSVRWERAATLVVALLVGDIAKAKAAGMTPADAGRADAKLFGPPNGWAKANTPFVLLRGMYSNWMSYPHQSCTLLEANERIARASCNRPYVVYFGATGQSMGVTVAEFEEANLAFERGIADYHGMHWEQHLEGDALVITIRKR